MIFVLIVEDMYKFVYYEYIYAFFLLFFIPLETSLTNIHECHMQFYFLKLSHMYKVLVLNI